MPKFSTIYTVDDVKRLIEEEIKYKYDKKVSIEVILREKPPSYYIPLQSMVTDVEFIVTMED